MAVPPKSVSPKHTCESLPVPFSPQRSPSPVTQLQLPRPQTSDCARPPGPSSAVRSPAAFPNCDYSRRPVGALPAISDDLFSLIPMEDSRTGRMVNTHQGCLNVRTQSNASWPCHFIPCRAEPQPAETVRENPGKNKDSARECEPPRIRKRTNASSRNAPPSCRCRQPRTASASSGVGREGRKFLRWTRTQV